MTKEKESFVLFSEEVTWPLSTKTVMDRPDEDEVLTMVDGTGAVIGEIINKKEEENEKD